MFHHPCQETFIIVNQPQTKSPLKDEPFQFMSLPSTVKSVHIFSSSIAYQLQDVKSFTFSGYSKDNPRPNLTTGGMDTRKVTST